MTPYAVVFIAPRGDDLDALLHPVLFCDSPVCPFFSTFYEPSRFPA